MTSKKGELIYQYSNDLSPHYHQKIQILTSQEIIDGKKFDTPPTLKDIQLYRDKTGSLFGTK